MQVVIPCRYTEMWKVDKHEEKLSLSTSCHPTQAVLKPYASHFPCRNIRPLQTTKTCNLQFCFLGLLSHSSSLHTFYQSSVLFSSISLWFSTPLLCCCLCQKDHILRLVIECLLAITPVAVNVVVWDGEESYALWPLWHETPSTAPLLQM